MAVKMSDPFVTIIYNVYTITIIVCSQFVSRYVFCELFHLIPIPVYI